MKTVLAEIGRTQPAMLQYDTATVVNPSIIRAIDERFLSALDIRSRCSKTEQASTCVSRQRLILVADMAVALYTPDSDDP
jgi:hypothetical protein